MRLASIGALLGAILLNAACGETVQTIPSATTRRVDSAAWEIKDNGFIAPGWTPGDQQSWNEQLKKRAQAQNDFATPK